MAGSQSQTKIKAEYTRPNLAKPGFRDGKRAGTAGFYANLCEFEIQENLPTERAALRYPFPVHSGNKKAQTIDNQ